MNLPRIAKILEDKNDLIVREVVLDKAQREEQIIYGARAINQQVPIYLRKKTTDYDILTKKPKKSARELVIELNRRLRQEEFSVVKAKHKGTYKIKDSKGNTIVDYTQLKKTPKTSTSYGNKLYNIKSIKRNIKRSIKKKGNEYRLSKDLESLNRIELSEKTFNF